MYFKKQIWFAGFWVITCLGFLQAQTSVVRGHSDTHKGMLYYDVHEADHFRPTKYIYTICPDDATCLSLDFNLVESQFEEDFIEVFEGTSPDSKQIGSLGGSSGSMILQSSTGCFTVVFKRDQKGLQSTWTAIWRSQKEGDCIQTGKGKSDCSDVQEICGPEYLEAFHYFGPGPLADSTLSAGCLEKEHNSNWYRFLIRKDGELNFQIEPRNGFDDYDWVLWKGDKDKPGQCPDLAQEEGKLACNFAGGRGQRASTGMNDLGDMLEAGADDNPFCKALEVRKGEVYYLLVDDYSKHSSGFKIVFNDVVLQCENEKKDFLPMGIKLPNYHSVVRQSDIFSKYSRVLRLDLTEKANMPLSECVHPPEIYGSSSLRGKSTKGRGSIPSSDFRRGIVFALLNCIRAGDLEAYAPDNLNRRLHYGDLLKFIYSVNEPFEEAETEPLDSVYGVSHRSWWRPPVEYWAGLEAVIELMVDEIFDKGSGRKRQEIRYIRLIYTDLEASQPDQLIALIPFRQEALEVLAEIPVQNAHNDAHDMSIQDFLLGQRYNAINVWHSGMPMRGPGEGQHRQERQRQLEEYRWDNQ